MKQQLQSLLATISESFNKHQLIKVSLGNKRDKTAALKNIFIKPVTIKNKLKYGFIITQDIQEVILYFFMINFYLV